MSGWWAQPYRAKRRHFFPEAGLSLCGGWSSSDAPVDPSKERATGKCMACQEATSDARVRFTRGTE